MEHVGAEADAAQPPEAVSSAAPSRVLDLIEPGSTTGVGSLPHRNAAQAVEFAFDAYDVPAIPSLPRRSPAESVIAQALVGAAGVTLGQYGTVAVDVEHLDPSAPVDTDLRRDNFVGFRTFLDTATERGYKGPIKWQFVGPISVGVALRRAGASTDVAFAVAVQAVSDHLRALSSAVSAALPMSPQLVVLDEPFADTLMSPDFPIAPDQAIDLLSEAMAVLEPQATIGVHCCGDADVATLLESGPSVLSLPASSSLVPLAGYLDRFLRNGGWIAWGAVATEGPIGVTSTRSWHQLAKVWCELVQRGCDAGLLRTQSLLTPECGLGVHSVNTAERLCHSLRDVSRSLRSEAAAAKFVLGA